MELRLYRSTIILSKIYNYIIMKTNEIIININGEAKNNLPLVLATLIVQPTPNLFCTNKEGSLGLL